MGWDARMNDSLQQVHSWKCIQTTAGFSFFSNAETTWATPVCPNPATVAAAAQN